MVLSQCLSKYKVLDLPLPRELVALHHPKQGLYDAIRVLSENHILSAPILDDNYKLIGILDTLDIVTHIVMTAAAGKAEVSDVAIDTLMGTTELGRCKVVGLNDSLEEVGDIFGGHSRRAVVLGEDSRPCSMLTRSTIVQFLASKEDFLEFLKHGAVASEHCSPGVITVNEKESALTAFQKLQQTAVTSLVISDEDNHALNVISATDLVTGLASLTQTPGSRVIDGLKDFNVLDFAVAYRRPDLRDRGTVTVLPTTPLHDVLMKLLLTRVHRVVVMGEDRKPIGVLSLTDICRAVAHAGPEWFPRHWSSWFLVQGQQAYPSCMW